MRVATIRDETGKQVSIHIKRYAYNGRWEWHVIAGSTVAASGPDAVCATKDDAYTAIFGIWGLGDWHLTWL